MGTFPRGGYSALGGKRLGYRTLVLAISGTSRGIPAETKGERRRIIASTSGSAASTHAPATQLTEPITAFT